MFKERNVNNVDMSGLRGTITKWPVQKTQRATLKHAKHQDATDI